MRNHDHRQVHVRVDFLDQVQDFVSRLRVKRTRRLVAKKNVRPRSQGARNCHALLLTARKRCDRGLFAVFESHKRKHFVNALIDIATIPARKFQRESHILARRTRTEQVEVLENHPDFEPAAVQFLFRQMAYADSVVIDLALVGSF